MALVFLEPELQLASSARRILQNFDGVPSEDPRFWLHPLPLKGAYTAGTRYETVAGSGF
jgi:hypothetical protein